MKIQRLKQESDMRVMNIGVSGFLQMLRLVFSELELIFCKLIFIILEARKTGGEGNSHSLPKS